MVTNTTLGKITAYLSHNWFKIGLIMLVVFAALKKDMSFNIKLNNPKPQEEEEQIQQPVRQEGKKSTERYTDAGLANVRSDRFDLSNLFSTGKTLSEDPLADMEESQVRAYIQRFSKVARGEQKKFGVPMSIILANALLQSHAGQSGAARQGHNHFDLPCTDDWQGAKNDYEGRCLRHYENAWTSFRDHSLFLTTGETGRMIQEMEPSNYKDWAKAIEKSKAFKGDKNLAEQLIRVVEDYGLE